MFLDCTLIIGSNLSLAKNWAWIPPDLSKSLNKFMHSRKNLFFLNRYYVRVTAKRLNGGSNYVKREGRGGPK